jgi:succinate dehydrogenase / fumarate reductase flavoprotein subunit
MREVKEGRGSPHGGVFLDISWIKARMPNAPEHIRKKLPSMYHQFKQLADIDITTTPMEVGPTTHYVMGGIRVDAETQMSNVEGLFACGECAAGLHGANRLGGNSLSDLIVFGKLAGTGAAKYIKSLSTSPSADAEQIEGIFRAATSVLNREAGENPYLLHEELQELMGRHVGIVRTGKELEEGIEKLATLKERVANVKAHGASQYNPGWHEALSLAPMLIVSEAVARAAHMREESRGAHTRIDFEGEQDEWLKYNVVIKRGANGELLIDKVERSAPPQHLADIARAKIEDLESGKVGADAPED